MVELLKKKKRVCWCHKLSCSDYSFTPEEEMLTECLWLTRTVLASRWSRHLPPERRAQT